MGRQSLLCVHNMGSLLPLRVHFLGYILSEELDRESKNQRTEELKNARTKELKNTRTEEPTTRAATGRKVRPRVCTFEKKWIQHGKRKGANART